MAVFRVEHNENYSTLSNYHFNDKTLSWKAKGLLSNMLALPPDWDYSLAGLTTLAVDGATATTSALKELEAHGYLIRRPIREKGKIVDWEYLIFEYPRLENPHLEKPLMENPKMANPKEEKPKMENQVQLNTKELNTKELNTKELSTKELSTKELNKKKERTTTYDELIQASGFDERVQQSLYEFIKMRKLIKKPMTDRALTNLISKLNTLSRGDNETADKILNQSIENAWQGIYGLKEEKTVARAKAEQESTVDFAKRMYDKYKVEEENETY